MEWNDAGSLVLDKSGSADIVKSEKTAVHASASDAFPVVHLRNEQLSAYRQMPLASLAALGAAFSQLPESARTAVQSVTRTIATDETLFVGINPKGVEGFLRANEYGTVGNILQINAQGKEVIAGRMRFKPIDGLPVTTIRPIDPTLMVVAVALMSIEKKLDGIQKSVDAVLQFLKQEKQSRQRGNLNMLSEIMEDSKRYCQNESFCASRLNEVLSIKTAAYQDIDFYQNQIAAELQKQKGFHGLRDSQGLTDALAYSFAEYQLACYLYAFSTFLDVVLRREFETTAVEGVAERLTSLAERYEALYTGCRAQIAQYQRSSVEAKVMGNIGVAAKGLGKAIASIPVIREGSVDEKLIDAGESIGRRNRNTVHRKLQEFEVFADHRMHPFIENLRSVDLLYNTENAMITDGTTLYLRQSE